MTAVVYILAGIGVIAVAGILALAIAVVRDPAWRSYQRSKRAAR